MNEFYPGMHESGGEVSPEIDLMEASGELYRSLGEIWRKVQEGYEFPGYQVSAKGSSVELLPKEKPLLRRILSKVTGWDSEQDRLPLTVTSNKFDDGKTCIVASLSAKDPDITDGYAWYEESLTVPADEQEAVYSTQRVRVFDSSGIDGKNSYHMQSTEGELTDSGVVWDRAAYYGSIASLSNPA